jgi:hypothetical protein
MIVFLDLESNSSDKYARASSSSSSSGAFLL